jgi:hypothetical protein
MYCGHTICHTCLLACMTPASKTESGEIALPHGHRFQALADAVDAQLESRQIVHGIHSVTCVVPRDFFPDDATLDASMSHSVDPGRGNHMLQEYIAYALETDFWNAIEAQNFVGSLVYLFAAIQNDSHVLCDNFYNALTDMRPEFVNIVYGQSVQNPVVLEMMHSVVNALIGQRTQ